MVNTSSISTFIPFGAFLETLGKLDNEGKISSNICQLSRQVSRQILLLFLPASLKLYKVSLELPQPNGMNVAFSAQISALFRKRSEGKCIRLLTVDCPALSAANLLIRDNLRTMTESCVPPRHLDN